MKLCRRWLAVAFTASLVVACGQPGAAAPQIGYLYPAGGRQGTTFRITAGGQSLRGTDYVRVSGEGVRASVVEYVRPLDNQELRETAGFLRELVSRRWVARVMDAAAKKAADGPALPDHPWLRDLDAKSPMELARLWTSFFDPKKQPNAQIAEQLVLEVTIDPDAAPGERELRVASPAGLSTALRFQVGMLPEVREEDFVGAGEPATPVVDLPALLNGQITPGDVDQYRLRARKGQKLVIRLYARRLIPYLADAVPGWFQATMTLRDPSGVEVAYSDDYRFDPDPLLFYEVPADGLYELEIRDAIYRGRDDFVYRIAVGELPFVTHIFPLGGQAGVPTVASIAGWNLPAETLELDTQPGGNAIRRATVGQEQGLLSEVRYAVDALPDSTETEPNDASGDAQEINFPLIVNGRIGRPGDVDMFRFEGQAGQDTVAEVYARRLDSPLDSVLRLIDSTGAVVALNDDHKDPEMGLITHQADSYVRVQLPKDGAYWVCLSDAQRHGGDAYAYRLRIRPAQPDFALHVTPSSVNMPAGRSAKVTVHVVRKDGFEGHVDVAVKDAPAGFTLSDTRIPSGEDSVEATLSAPRGAPRQVVPVGLEGRAEIGGVAVARPVVPAEDQMQAFLWRFIVPQQELLVAVTGSRPVPTVWRPLAPGMKLAGADPVRIPLGGTAQVQVDAPQTLPDRRQSELQMIRFRLSNRPRGVTLQGATVGPGGVTLTLKADANLALAGDSANAIVEASAEPTGEPRVSLGVLPAIPFQIVRP